METLTSSDFTEERKPPGINLSEVFRCLILSRGGALLQMKMCIWSLVPTSHVSVVLQTFLNPVQFHLELFPKLTSLGPHSPLTNCPPYQSRHISLSACERASTCPSQPSSWISVSRPFQAPGNLARLFGSSLNLLEIPEAHSLHNANWVFSSVSKSLQCLEDGVIWDMSSIEETDQRRAQSQLSQKPRLWNSQTALARTLQEVISF